MLQICDANPYLERIFGHLRDADSDCETFRRFAELCGDYLLQECMKNSLVLLREKEILTPTNACVKTVFLNPSKILAVPIFRAGNAFLNSVFRVLSPGVPVAQLVIQRDELTAEPCVLLSKFPAQLEAFETVLLLDPMLATGGSVLAAIAVLIDLGVALERIVLVHALAAPEGLAAVHAKYPAIRGVVGVVDSHLNSDKFIVPGLGDFGDRFFA